MLEYQFKRKKNVFILFSSQKLCFPNGPIHLSLFWLSPFHMPTAFWFIWFRILELVAIQLSWGSKLEEENWTRTFRMMVQHHGEQPQICISAWAPPGFVFYYFQPTNKILHDSHSQSAVYLPILAGSYSLYALCWGFFMQFKNRMSDSKQMAKILLCEPQRGS